VAILNKVEGLQCPKLLQRFVARAYLGNVTKAFKENRSGFEASEKKSTWGGKNRPTPGGYIRLNH